MGDYYGRRPIYRLGYVMNLVFIMSLMVSTNIFIDYVALFGLGLSIASRYYVGYTYNIEMCPKDQQNLVSAF